MEFTIVYLLLTLVWFAVGGLRLVQALDDIEHYTEVLEDTFLQTPKPLRPIHLWGCFMVLVPFMVSVVILRKITNT